MHAALFELVRVGTEVCRELFARQIGVDPIGRRRAMRDAIAPIPRAIEAKAGVRFIRTAVLES